MTRTDYSDRVEFIDYSLRLVVPKTVDFAAHLRVDVDATVGDVRLAPVAPSWEYQDAFLQANGSLILGVPPFSTMTRTDNGDSLTFIDGAIKLTFPKTDDFAAHLVADIDATIGDSRLPTLDIATWSTYADAIEASGSLMGAMPATNP